VAVEPDAAMAALLHGIVSELRVAAFEDVELEDAAFDLAVSATAFHWVDEAVGLQRVAGALRPGGSFCQWWTMFGDPRRPDAFHLATQGVVGGLPEGPSRGGGLKGPPFGLDALARRAALERAGFVDVFDEEQRWDATFEPAGVRALYGTFSPILMLPDDERERALDGLEQVATDRFGGQVTRPLVTTIYACRRVSES
jgi:SAM-dependent methyltransferase